MYEKLNFEKGQVLTAEALNHMEEGIEKAGIGDATIAFDLFNTEAIKETFEKYNLASKAGCIISCRIKLDSSDPEYLPVSLVVEYSEGSGHRLNFVAAHISDAKLYDLPCISYFIDQSGEVQFLGTTSLLIADEALNSDSVMPLSNKALYVLLTEYAKKNELPTKTSQLANDSGFITKNAVPNPDWNASTYKEGHIKNRTHHMQDHMCHYFKGSPIKISKPSGVGYVLLTYDTDLADKFIRITISADESKTHEFLDAMGMPLIFRWDADNSTINVESFMGAVETYDMRAYYSSSAKGFKDYFTKLDVGFMPKKVITTENASFMDNSSSIILPFGIKSGDFKTYSVEGDGNSILGQRKVDLGEINDSRKNVIVASYLYSEVFTLKEYGEFTIDELKEKNKYGEGYHWLSEGAGIVGVKVDENNHLWAFLSGSDAISWTIQCNAYSEKTCMDSSWIKYNGEGLNVKIAALEEALSPRSMVSITYAELVVLREREQLAAGTYYRITDYETTTAQENTRSAGHPFDVVVLALSESTLAEEAYAVHSDRDTNGYFQMCNLSAWKLWYALDNNAQRFAWADTENGKGVIYRMIDEWNNDLPYDFKNIQFARYELNIPEYNEAFSTVEKAIYDMVKTEMEAGNEAFVYAGLNGGGKIWDYDDERVVSTASGRVAWCYTFNDIQGSPTDGYDYSKPGGFDIANNYMGFYFHPEMASKSLLPNNVFLYEAVRDNHFGFHVTNNTFMNVQRSDITLCFDNVASMFFFGVKLRGVSGSAFASNITNIKAEECSGLFLGARCERNEFGVYCSKIVLGENSINNTFGKECYNVLVEEGTNNKTISLNSNGEIKMFNLADLADLLNS
mgnify:CR=1 FL=1